MDSATKPNEISFSPRRRNMIFAVLLFGCILCSLLQTALNTILPAIMRDFAITASTGQWLTTVYSLAMGIMIPATPLLMKRFPTKQLFLMSMSVFTIGLLLSATAASFPVLMLGRILQALGCGVLLSLVQVVVLTIYPIDKRGLMMGIFGLAVTAVPILSPTLAGFIVDRFRWNTLFWGATLFAVIDLLAAAFTLKSISEPQKQRFDIGSMLLCSIGFSGILISMGNVGARAFFSLSVALPLCIGIASIALFTLRQLRAETPLLELRIFKNRELKFGVIESMFLYAVLMAGALLLPIYLQMIRGYSATASGLINLPGSIAMAVASPFAGKLYDKFGIRKLLIFGSAGLVLSCIGFSFLGVSASLVYVSILTVIRAVSVACMMMPLLTWGLSTLDSDYTAHGTAIISTLRTIAGAFSPALFVSIMTAAGAAIPICGMKIALAGIAAVAALQCAVAVFFVGKAKNRGVACYTLE